MDKTVKFKIELETNGQKVLHDVTVSTGELRDALVEVECGEDDLIGIYQHDG